MDVIFGIFDGKRVEGKVSLEISFPKDTKAYIGPKGFLIFDKDVGLAEILLRYVEAFQKESCGKCTPCRIGGYFMLQKIKKIILGEGDKKDLLEIKDIAKEIFESAKCLLGKSVPQTILEILESSGDDLMRKCEVQEREVIYKAYAPCQQACPAHIDIPAYIEAISEGKFEEALDIIREGACLPQTLGRVCVNPCEEACTRGVSQEPVAIRQLKRFVGDYEQQRKKMPNFSKNRESGKKVCVIGAGPCGLNCAFHLARKGHKVVIFEKREHGGGMARYGIPEYRLPSNVLDREIEIVKSAGVDIRFCEEIDESKFSKLKDEFDALFVACGAMGSAKLRAEGEDEGYDGFITGIAYLDSINQGKDPFPEKKVAVVVGGGNVAMDCARSALRTGKDVKVIYRRTLLEMPARREEYEEAKEEGVEFIFLVAPKRIIAKDGKVVGVECVKMELGEPDESGRRRPKPIPSSEHVIDCDLLISAIGQRVVLPFPIEKDKNGTVIVDPLTLSTDIPKVFAGGDCVTGPNVLIKAIALGKRAAESIDLYLKGVSYPRKDGEVISFCESVFPDFSWVPLDGRDRKKPKLLEPLVRKRGFLEIEPTFSVKDAIFEAQRCLRCITISMFIF